MKKLIRPLIIGVILIIIAIVLYFFIQAYVDNFSKNRIVNENTAPVCDAIMVLGAGVYGDTPSPALEDRLIYGLELYNNKKAEKIIVSGDHGRVEYDEVNVMKQYLMDRGVPREDIFLDHAGFDTYDSMYRAKEIFGVKSLIISTQNFHINRSIYLAEKMDIDAYGYPSEDKEIYYMSYLNKREKLAKIKAFIDADILHRKPKFSGEAIPINGSGLLTEG